MRLKHIELRRFCLICVSITINKIRKKLLYFFIDRHQWREIILRMFTNRKENATI